MKHRKALILTGMVLLLGVNGRWAEAASVGLAPEKQGVSASVEYTHIFDQDLEESSDTKGPAVEQSQAILTKVNYAFDEHYSLYAKIGTADLDGSLTGVSGADRATYKLEYDFGFAFKFSDREWG